jgi:ribosomal protein L35
MKRFKVTALGKVRFYPPGKQHKNTGTAGTKGQKQRKPRYMEAGDARRIKVTSLWKTGSLCDHVVFVSDAHVYATVFPLITILERCSWLSLWCWTMK